MQPLAIIGDVHGCFTRVGSLRNRPSLHTLLQDMPFNTIQIGDYGIFDGQDVRTLKKIKPRKDYTDRFFRGNHDNPALCKKQSNYLGDFGILPDYPEIMFFAGAESCDAKGRVEGKSWWADEQLSEDQMIAARDLYERTKPKIILSHECPSKCYGVLAFDQGFNPYKSSQNRTARFLDSLLGIHKPQRWYFGHHHQSRGFEMDGTMFRCVDELEVVPVILVAPRVRPIV